MNPPFTYDSGSFEDPNLTLVLTLFEVFDLPVVLAILFQERVLGLG
jgi:hypothetical protein